VIEDIFGVHVWWYLSRSTGFVAWVLLSASVIWGLLMSGGIVARGRHRLVSMEVHRFLGTLALAFTGLHIASLLPDTYVDFTLVDLFVPFASSWHPVAVAWGITGLYLLLAVQLTSQLMRWLPHRLWRAVHLSSFPLFGVATIHILSAGSSAGNPLVVFAAAGLTVFIALLTAMRVAFARADEARRQAARLERAVA
jgi:predicted ferric reductase